MAASFASRLSNLRQKKISNVEEDGAQLRLTLPPDASQKSAYEPSKNMNNTRTSFRLLKGRIDRGNSTQKPDPGNGNPNNNQPKTIPSIQKLSLPDENRESMKLVLNDDGPVEEKKSLAEPPKIPIQKRIMISKEAPKQAPTPPPEPEKREVAPPPPPREEEKIVPQEQRPIKEEEAEESLPAESELDLVLCPEGCGRKFNRKALEKHAKACKLVFMSKRKEFNSQAKRITSKEQATLVKQTKIEEKKKMGMTRKGFDKTKTGQNWKAASQEFRAAIKGMKKEENEDEEEAEVDGEDMEDKKVVHVECPYCGKKFNEVFIDKHQNNCPRRKDKKKTTKR